MEEELNKPKIVFLNIHNGLANRGVETVINEIAKRILNKYQVILYQGGPIDKKIKYPIRRITFGNFRHQTLMANLIFSLKAVPFLIKEKPNIIQPFNGRFEAVLSRLISWFMGAKLVIAGHSGSGKDEIINLWACPDIFICLSKKGKNWAEKWAFWVKKTLIHNGVNCLEFKSGICPKKINLQPPIFLIVAGPEHFKRVDLAIKAVAKLSYGSLLVIGEQEEKIINFGKRILSTSRVKFIKKVKHKDMPKLYNSSKVFTLPSESTESSPISYLEAMACNLPVVARNDSLRKELIGKAGILINPENIKEYAWALDRASQKNWGVIPRKQAEKFSWDLVIKNYIRLFDKLLK
jgi:glycosyltransferase involved in cell wall biosynthesis